MVVYHVCSLKKLNKYLVNGKIYPPVRAWIDVKEAERFSKQTGRQIILRLKFPNKFINQLEGHKGKAVFIDQEFPLKQWLLR